jgi:hypothetical protein
MSTVTVAEYPASAGFMCDKAAVLGAALKETPGAEKGSWAIRVQSTGRLTLYASVTWV